MFSMESPGENIQSIKCPLLAHHQEAELIVFILPGKISSLLRPRQRRQKMLSLKFARDRWSCKASAFRFYFLELGIKTRF